MRIISGKWKGRSLFFDKNQDLRPTQDKIKESIFNILQKRIEGAWVLDLFCGTGSLGLEALSRGAAYVAFTDQNTEILRKNLELLDIKAGFKTVDSLIPVSVFPMDIERFFKKNTLQYDLILIDPPYHNTELYELTLKKIKEGNLLKENGWIICEHHRKMNIESLIQAPYTQQYSYGNTRVTVIKAS